MQSRLIHWQMSGRARGFFPRHAASLGSLALAFALGCNADGGTGSTRGGISAGSGAPNPLSPVAPATTAGSAGSIVSTTPPVIPVAGTFARAGSAAPITGFPLAGSAAIGSGGISGGIAGAPAIAGAAGMIAAGAGAPPPVAGSGATTCPAPAAGASDEAIAALNATNKLRLAAGSGCMQLAPALDKSALSHCMYFANNAANAMCIADAHGEVMSCMGFTGADVQAREIAAGYPDVSSSTEVFTEGGTPAQAVQGWVDTLWHRIPMLDPWRTDMGYASATGCNVIDFGGGKTKAPATTVVVYPYDGQTGLPVSFDGNYESPMPPAPSTGWPSSSMINVYAQAIKVTDHVLTKDGDDTPLPHTWIDMNSTSVGAGYLGYLYSTAFIYGDKPFAPNTKYRVHVTGTHSGGALNVEWTFTTGAAPTNPWGM